MATAPRKSAQLNWNRVFPVKKDDLAFRPETRISDRAGLVNARTIAPGRLRNRYPLPLGHKRLLLRSFNQPRPRPRNRPGKRSAPGRPALNRPLRQRAAPSIQVLPKKARSGFT